MARTPTNTAASGDAETPGSPPLAPSTEQLAQSPTWGQGGRYVINPTTGERELAQDQE